SCFIIILPVSCVSLLNNPPTFSVSSSYGIFIGVLSVFNDFWYSCINLSVFCLICPNFWLSRSYSCLCYSVFCLYWLICSCFAFVTCLDLPRSNSYPLCLTCLLNLLSISVIDFLLPYTFFVL